MKEVIDCFGYCWCIEHTPKNNGLKVTLTISHDYTSLSGRIFFTL